MTTLFVGVVGAVLGVAVSLWWLRVRVVVVTVDGVSMEPTLRSRDRVVVRRVSSRRLMVGQVVVVRPPYHENGQWHWPSPGHPAAPRWVIKRIAALPGDRVPPGIATCDPVVPAGHLIVLGDNPAASVDSRKIGHFPLEQVLGIAVRKLA